MKQFIAKKIGMTQAFDEEGLSFAVTVLQLVDTTVTQVKTPKKEGYSALQVGYTDAKAKHLSKAEQGHLKAAGKLFRHLVEFDLEADSTFSVGDVLEPQLEVGHVVTLTGFSKGKGTQGGIRRWGHHRGLMSHGSKSHRLPGSIGAGTTPSRVYPGTKMAGRMGAKKVHHKGLQVLRIDSENKLVVIKGSVPGANESLLIGTVAS